MSNHSYNSHETKRMIELHGLPLASFRSRFFAFGIDFIIIFIIFIALIMLYSKFAIKLGLLQIAEDVNLQFDLKHWYSLVFVVVYFTLFNYFGKGRTLGKMIFGIRTISLVHDRLNLWHSFERSLGYAASALEMGFGFIQYFIHPNKRTVHDRIAETIVIVDPKKEKKKKVKKEEVDEE